MSNDEHEAAGWGAGRSDAMAYTDYDEQYPQVFAELVRDIRAVLPSARIEHVGSTSIRGLGGRRVLDVVVLAEPENHDEMESRLLSIGFVKSPFAYFLPMLIGSIHYEEKDYSVLLYLLPETDHIFQGWLAFRAYMNRHPEEIQRYAEVKKRAIAEGNSDQASYQQAKTPCLEDLAQRVEVWSSQQQGC